MTTNTNAETFKAFYEAERRAEDLESLLRWLKASQLNNELVAQGQYHRGYNLIPQPYIDILIPLVEQALKDL